MSKAMKLLIIEDDINDCENFISCIKKRDDFELVAITDSDIEALKYVKLKHPEGIVLDLELNNSKSGNTNSLEFLSNLRKLRLNYKPIIIVTTHVNSDTTYRVLHREKIDLIMYKDQASYSCDNVLNTFLKFRDETGNVPIKTITEELEDNENKISEMINHELDLIGINRKFKGRDYIHDAILYLIENDESDANVMQYLTKTYKKAGTTINNGIQISINNAWRYSSVEDLEKYYTNKINYKTGVPTPTEFICYYRDKIKTLI